MNYLSNKHEKQHIIYCISLFKRLNLVCWKLLFLKHFFNFYGQGFEVNSILDYYNNSNSSCHASGGFEQVGMFNRSGQKQCISRRCLSKISSIYKWNHFRKWPAFIFAGKAAAINDMSDMTSKFLIWVFPIFSGVLLCNRVLYFTEGDLQWGMSFTLISWTLIL